MTKEVQRDPVLLSADEKHEVVKGLALRRAELDKQHKKLEEMEVETVAIDRIIKVHKGNGASGGLTSRISGTNPDTTREMFPDVREPQGSIRQLEDLLPGEEPTAARPVETSDGEPTWFEQDEILRALTSESPVFGTNQPQAWDKSLVEDQDGQVFRVRVDVGVAFEFVGTRSPVMVDAAVQASDEAAGAAIDDVSGKKQAALRKMAVRAIEAASTLTVKARERLAAYATTDADNEWLKSWAGDSLPLGQRPQVPEDWEPYAPGPKNTVPPVEDTTAVEPPAAPEPKPAPEGTPLPSDRLKAPVKFTDGGWKAAQEAKVTLEELRGREGSASGNRFAKSDVDAIVSEREAVAAT